MLKISVLRLGGFVRGRWIELVAAPIQHPPHSFDSFQTSHICYFWCALSNYDIGFRRKSEKLGSRSADDAGYSSPWSNIRARDIPDSIYSTDSIYCRDVRTRGLFTLLCEEQTDACTIEKYLLKNIIIFIFMFVQCFSNLCQFISIKCISIGTKDSTSRRRI